MPPEIIGAILRVVEQLARVPEPMTGRWAEIVASARASGLFREVDVRFGARAGIVVFELDPSADLEQYAAAVARLGPAVDLQVVSPPIRDPEHPDRAPDWHRKHGVCHIVGDRRVWFSLETVDECERLRSIAIHYDRGEATGRLPPPGEEAAARFTVSTGWCGGHGEAILDDNGRIRKHGGLPIYLDDDGWRMIRERIDLAGVRRGHPVVHVTARVRLEQRKARNTSIPKAPKERYFALLVTSLDEVEVVGER